MTHEDALNEWLALLNRVGGEPHALADDVVVIYFPQGKGGPPAKLLGVDEVMSWATRGPAGRYLYAASEPEPCEPSAALPDPDAAFTCRYSVTSLEAKWSNTGDWTIHVAGERIAGVLHEPDPLPDDSAMTL